MRNNLTPAMIAEYSSGHVNPVVMAEMFFDSGTLRLWTGYGTLDWGDNAFFGGGNLIGVSPIEETQELQAKGIVCTLSGIPTNILALSLGERSRGRNFRLYLASATTKRYVATEDGPGRVELEDGSGFILLENQLVDSPYRIFSGLMDTIEITNNGETADVRMSVESILITGQRQKIRRYTNEDQRKRFPNDRGLEFINQLQDKELVW